MDGGELKGEGEDGGKEGDWRNRFEIFTMIPGESNSEE